MARIATCDCLSVVPNRCELVLLARRPDHKREAKAIAAPRRIAKQVADPEILRINRWRRMNDTPLPGGSNGNHPRIAPAASEAQAA